MVRERACGVFDGLPMNKIVLIFASLLMGCGVNWWSATPTHTPDGREGYIVECREIGDCWALAGIKCPAGYRLVDADHAVDGASAYVNSHVAITRMHGHYDLLIECREPNDQWWRDPIKVDPSNHNDGVQDPYGF